MKFRSRLIKKWKESLRRKTFNFAYEQGKFDKEMEYLTKKLKEDNKDEF